MGDPRRLGPVLAGRWYLGRSACPHQVAGVKRVVDAIIGLGSMFASLAAERTHLEQSWGAISPFFAEHGRLRLDEAVAEQVMGSSRWRRGVKPEHQINRSVAAVLRVCDIEDVEFVRATDIHHGTASQFTVVKPVDRRSVLYGPRRPETSP